jgi:hypothetical protein
VAKRVSIERRQTRDDARLQVLQEALDCGEVHSGALKRRERRG